MRNQFALIGLIFLLPGMSLVPVAASDWLTLPSTFTHDPSTGGRVSQFAQVQAPAAPTVSNFRTSGYTHTRSTLNYGQSADNYHRVEQWGDPVRPYGEWRFPYRPYSTPYQNWGAPLAGLNLGYGTHPGYGPRGHGGGYQPGMPAGGNLGRPTVPGQPQNGSSPLLPSSGFQNPLNPYPIEPGSAYPDAPYYDGYHPNYRQ